MTELDQLRKELAEAKANEQSSAMAYAASQEQVRVLRWTLERIAMAPDGDHLAWERLEIVKDAKLALAQTEPK